MNISDEIECLGSVDRATVRKAERSLGSHGPDLLAEVAPYLSNTGPLTRCRIAMVVGKVKSEFSYPFLEKMLDDTNKDVQYDVIIAMGRLGDKRAVPLLADLLNDGASTEALASVAAMSLAKFKDAAMSFIEPMARSERATERRRAGHILGAIRSPTARRILIQLLGDESSSVRIEALESICEWGRRVARPYLLKLLNDPDEEVAHIARYWLDELK